MEKNRAARAIAVIITTLSAFLSLLAVMTVATRFGFSPHSFHDSSKVFDPTTLITSILVLTVPIALVIIGQKALIRRSLFQLGFTGRFWSLFLAGCGIGASLKGLSTFAAFTLSPNAVSVPTLGTFSLQEALPYFLWFFAALLLNSLNEELVFRVFPLTHLQSVFASPKILVWLTAIAFSLMHFLVEPPDFYHFLYRLGFGLLAGQLFINTGSLWTVVGLHTGWNFIALAINDSDWRMGCLLRVNGLREHSEVLANVVFLALAFILASRARAIPKIEVAI